MPTRLILVILVCSCFLFAAEPLATLTAGPDCKLNGKLLPATGVPNWPVVAGDEIIAGASPAVLVFTDGARLKLAAGVKVVILNCDRCVVQQFSGTLEYTKPAESKLEICALGHAVRPKPSTAGSVTVTEDKVFVTVAGEDKSQVASGNDCACDAAAPWAKSWLRSKRKALLIILGGGAATAATVGVAAQSDPKSER